MTTEQQRNAIWIGFGFLLLLIAVAYRLKPDATVDPTDAPVDDKKTEPQTGATETNDSPDWYYRRRRNHGTNGSSGSGTNGSSNGNSKNGTGTNGSATAKKCWKRHTGEVSVFSALNARSFTARMSKLYTRDVISHAAAFLKGMNIEFNQDKIKEYLPEIKEFMAKPPKPLIRNNDYVVEIQNQVFKAGDLDCAKTTLSQHYLTV